MKTIATEELLVYLNEKCSERIDGKKICCISGEHGVGKSTLASMFAMGHHTKSTDIKHLQEYEYVLVVSGKQIEQTSMTKWVGNTKSQRNDLDNFIDDYWSISECFLPGCCAKYGIKNVGQFLTSKQILFIIDDGDEISEGKMKELILFLGQITFSSSVIILGNLDWIMKLKFNFISYSSVQHLHLHGISKDYILEKATKLKENVKTAKKKVQRTFKDAIKVNMNRIGRLFHYPSLIKDILSMWRTRSSLVRDLHTATELLWNLVVWKTNGALQVDLNKDARKKRKWLKWLILTGKMTSYCLKANLKLNEASFEEIKQSAEKDFSAEEAENLLKSFFKRRLVYSSDNFLSGPCSTSRPQMEFLSSYFLIHELANDEKVSINAFLPAIEPEVVLALLVGHMKRWDESVLNDETPHEISFDLMNRLIETIAGYEEDKTEDVEFLLKLATEFRGSHKLIQLMVNVTEYPEEWDLKFCYLQQKSLDMLLQHVSPVRIILRTDRQIQNYEHVSLLKFLGRVPISIWFESRDQFQYDSLRKMDKYLKPFLSDTVVARCDLLSGSVSRILMMDMLDYRSMSYMVMLALKVTNEESLSTALSLPSHLPHLLWFELKIDMNIENVVLTSLPNMTVDMFDVYLRDLDDLCIPQITGLLTKMHKRYSGIHLDRTTLSPESIFTLLKELKNRDVTLCASPKAIDKYRRWYYPLLANMPTDRLLTNKEVKTILGFEDRKFYSEHKIHSSMFVKSIDAWNLTSYLEELKEIKYFEYNADNLSFIKTLKGEVKTEHHSEIKVDTTGEIL